MIKNRKNTINYHLMLLPGILLVVVYNILPVLGNVIAFQNFNPSKGIFGSAWVGLDNILYMLQIPDSKQVFINTLVISISKIVFSFLASVAFAILLNEVRLRRFKRTVQTIVYIPHFLSWVVLASQFILLLDLNGIVNNFVEWLGFERIMFLGDNGWFRPVLVFTEVWKSFGFGAIVYLSAITAIDPTLYESAAMDGASRWQNIIHITLPQIAPTMILMLTLSLGNVLNAGFDQVYNLYNPLVYQTGDIIDTYVYRIGMVQMQYGLATAVGLLKSVVSFILVIISYFLADKFANYRIF